MAENGKHEISFRFGVVDWNRTDPIDNCVHLMVPNMDGVCRDAWRAGFVDDMKVVAAHCTLDEAREELDEFFELSDENEWDTDYIDTANVSEAEKNGARLYYLAMAKNTNIGPDGAAMSIQGLMKDEKTGEIKKYRPGYFEIPPITDEPKEMWDLAYYEFYDEQWLKDHPNTMRAKQWELRQKEQNGESVDWQAFWNIPDSQFDYVYWDESVKDFVAVPWKDRRKDPDYESANWNGEYDDPDDDNDDDDDDDGDD